MSTVELPELPPEFRLSRDGDSLSVRLPSGKVRKLPVLTLRTASLPTLTSLVAARSPHVVLAPHLTTATRDLLRRRGWGWIDSSGSARIADGELFVYIDRVERAKTSGLSLPPQGDRIVRLLLDEYPREFRLTEIANETDLDKGYTSRMVRRLVDSGTVERAGRGPVRVVSPAELFELWSHGPDRVEPTLWFIAGGPEAILARLRESKPPGGLALTGVCAATLLTPHVTLERIEAYVVDRRAALALGKQIGAEAVARGHNLSLLVPRDPAVTRIGVRTRAGLRLVSVTQIYRDALRYGRGREQEAAGPLRREQLRW